MVEEEKTRTVEVGKAKAKKTLARGKNMKESKSVSSEANSKPAGKYSKIAVIRVRGRVDVRRDIEDTLAMMHLNRVNTVTVIDGNPTSMGMVKKVKDFVTWGEIDEETFAALVEKWGRKSGGHRLAKEDIKDFPKKFIAGQTTFKDAGIKPYFRLHPPSKGYERGGIKTHVNIGGVLGYRGKDINTLLAKIAGL